MFVKLKEKLKKIKIKPEHQARLHVQKPAAKKSEKLSQHVFFGHDHHFCSCLGEKTISAA